MIKNIFYMTLLAVVTLSISYLMFPREKEIGLMQLKSRDFDSAQVSFEEQLANGDVSISVVGPLSEIYLHKGEIDSSIAVLETFLDESPDHVTGLRRLAQYFKEAQRPNGQVRTLARLAELEETPAILRELAGRHGLLVNEGAQAKVLSWLVDGGGASAQEYDRLARHQAARGQLGAAADTLHALITTHGQNTPSESIELLVGLLLDLGNAQAAAAIATRSLDAPHKNGFAESLASQFAERRRPDLAIRILRPVIKRRPDDVTLVSSAIQYEALTGNTGAALQRLQNYARSHSLPDNLTHDLVVLLLAENKPKEAHRTFRSLKAERIPGWLVSALVTNASERQRPYLIQNLSTFLGDSYLTHNPILAAEIALAQNELDEVNIWIEWAESESRLPYRDRLVLVRLYQNIQRPDDALILLRKLTDEGVGKSAEISALADVYLTTDRASDGQSVFDILRRSNPSTDMDAAWARLAAKTKRAGAVFRWINSTPVIGSATLEDIFRFAELNRQPALSLAAAERLRTAYPTIKSRRLHARALAANGYAENATQRFDQLIDDGARLDNDDLAVLSQIGATDQLDRYWANRDTLGSGSEKGKLATLFAGARRAAAQLVLPRFEKLARSKGGFWFDTFAETARLAGEIPRLKKYLKAESERTDLTPKETRQIATTLFDVSPADSLNLYARMVRKDPDAWGDDYIDTLMALGRTRKLVSFLASEIDRPNISDSQRDSRLYALVENAGPAAAEAPLRRLAKTEGGDWEYAYEETLVSLGKEQTLYDFLATKADQQDLDAAERNGIAYRLLEAGRKPSAERNFLKLAASAGPQDTAVQQLLFLWGPRPETHQLDWLEQRARNASGIERSQWLRHLRDRGASDRVIQISEFGDTIPGINSPEREVYLDVIVSQRDSARLRRFIRSELVQENNPEQVRKLAKLAVQENLPKVATDAYRSVFTLRPGDVEAAGWLGRVAYAEDRREDAMELIALTLGKHADDYESHYIYGELLYADERRVEALPHLRKAKEMIEASAHKTIEMRLAWGQALFRLGHLNQAIDVYAGLYAERSDDPGIRADYASLLIDARDYQRAQTVLWSN